MKNGMLAFIVVAATLACAKGEVVAPSQYWNLPEEVPGGRPPNGHFVSPSGSSAGDGSYQHPWNLATALAQPATVVPGDTIWMMGGTYTGPFVSKLTGTSTKPVVLRQLAGQRATVDGRFEIDGSYTYYWGFEVMDSDPKRVTTIAGSDPADLPRQNVTVFVLGPFNKIINMVIHDLGDGLFAGSAAQGLEITGSVFYNNGWEGPDRGHGHNVYLQNQYATKVVTDNVLFNSFSEGLHMYGTDAAYLYNFDVEGNTIAGSGSPVAAKFGLSSNILLQGAGGKMAHFVFKANNIDHTDGTSIAVGLNTPGGAQGQDVQFLDNTVHGQAQFNEMDGYVVTGNTFTTGGSPLATQNVLVSLRLATGQSLSANRWDSNKYAAPSTSTQDPFYLVNGTTSAATYKFAGWRTATGYDGVAQYTSGSLAGSQVSVRPSKYEPGYATIICWNWSAASTVAVDLSTVLRGGDRYEIRHVYDLFGSVVASGVYGGGSVNLATTGYNAPAPIGYGVTPPSTSSYLNVFIVRKK